MRPFQLFVRAGQTEDPMRIQALRPEPGVDRFDVRGVLGASPRAIDAELDERQRLDAIDNEPMSPPTD